MELNSSSSKRPMGGQPKSEASSLSSPDIRALWEEPTEAISQKPARGRRNPLPSGRGGCQRREKPGFVRGFDTGMPVYQGSSFDGHSSCTIAWNAALCPTRCIEEGARCIVPLQGMHRQDWPCLESELALRARLKARVCRPVTAGTFHD